MVSLSVFHIFKTNTISNRTSADIILSYAIRNAEIDELDFSDIEFVTRSFAHQLKTGIKTLKRIVKLSNTNSAVTKMLEVVGVENYQTVSA